MKDKLTILIDRLKKIGITIELGGNYPWIYIDKVDGKRVTDRYLGNHGFTIAFAKLKGGVELTDITEIFKIIRKYRDISTIRDNKINKII